MKNKKKEIADASVEMLEILKYASPDVKSKISEEYNDFFKKASLKSLHRWKYDTSKKLYEQNMSEMTKKILCEIYNRVFNK